VSAEADEAELAARAVDGDKAALEEVVRLLQDPLYRLALRMTWRPADAEDATQEILIRVVTRLASWRGEAELLTWAYRIGVNYLLNLRRKTPREAQQLSLDEFRADLADGWRTPTTRARRPRCWPRRRGCPAPSRCCSAWSEASGYRSCSATSSSSHRRMRRGYSKPARRRTANGWRGRHRIRAFMESTCGLVNPEAFCRCAGRVPKAIDAGHVNQRTPSFTVHPVSPSGRGVAEAADQLHRLHDAAAVLRAHPDYAAPQAKVDANVALLQSGRFPLQE
jgi:RNA polymerase sigma factor (sigma-70 family)